jgi:hypothetical protein
LDGEAGKSVPGLAFLIGNRKILDHVLDPTVPEAPLVRAGLLLVLVVDAERFEFPAEVLVVGIEKILGPADKEQLRQIRLLGVHREVRPEPLSGTCVV